MRSLKQIFRVRKSILILAVLAVLAWRDKYWTLAGRLHYTVVAVSLVAFIVWANYFNLLGFNF